MIITLPSTHPSTSRQSPRQLNYPLTPPTVTPPSVSAHTSCATKQKHQQSAKATALLSKVASTHASPKRCNTESSLSTLSCSEKSGQRPDCERRYSDSHEAMKSWSGHSQRDGYVSFPDFEYFEEYRGYSSQEHPREGIKT